MYSHSLVSVIDLWVRVVTKLVSEPGFHCWSLKCHFVFFLHYCGIRLSNVGSIIIACSILRFVYFIVVFWFYLVCLLWIRRRAWDAPAAEAADDVEQFFQDEALAPAPRCRGRGSSGKGVMSQGVIVLDVSLEMDLLAWFYVNLIARDI